MAKVINKIPQIKDTKKEAIAKNKTK